MTGTQKLEIEYKFGIQDAETFEKLAHLTNAGEYSLSEKSHPLFTDIFYDTPDLLLYSLGIYLRKRLEEGKSEAVWTLKKTETEAEHSVEGGHRRFEIIQTLPMDSTVEDITDSNLKKILLKINAEWIPILTMTQDRIFKTVYKKGVSPSEPLSDSLSDFENPENRLADFSVDLVGLKFFEQNHTFTELEIELANGTEEELNDFMDVLKDLPEFKDKISPNRFSKLDRGLIFYFNRDKIEGQVISGFEKKSYFTDLDDFKEQENESDDLKKAEAYDSSDSGFLLPREKAALLQICGKTYDADPMDYFGETGFIFRYEREKKEETKKETDTEKETEKGEEKGRETENQNSLNGIEREESFDEQASVLLALDSGMSLSFAAQTFQIGEERIEAIRKSFDEKRIGLFPFVFEMKENEAYYHQKHEDFEKIWTPEELALYYGLNPEKTEDVVQVAEEMFDSVKNVNRFSEREKKILKAAILLEKAGEGITQERGINIAADIVLTHPIKDLNVDDIQTLALIFILKEIKNPTFEKIKRAIQKAGFFVPPSAQKNAVVLTEIFKKAGAYVAKYKTSEAEKDEKKTEKDEKKQNVQIEASDMMPVAAEKIFLEQLWEVEKAEPGVFSERDIEDVHDMRVALRRMRSAIIVFEDYLDENWVLKTEFGLKKTLSSLGEMRDLDVILEKTDSWRKEKEIPKEDMIVFYERVAADRKNAHLVAVKYLESEEYVSFKNELKKTLEDNVYLGVSNINRKGDVLPIRIHDVLPKILHQKAADVTAYHEWMNGPYILTDKLHRLRIAAKNFRYTLDFFKSCLGDASAQLIKEFKEVQDILGDFHDAVVAIFEIEVYVKKIEDLRPEKEEESQKAEMSIRLLNEYKKYREQEMEDLLFVFHDKWEKMDRRFFNEKISKIIEEADF
ncbi:MAG: CHAD domain-containing protein [Methanimicrococcus sp.]|nr:CHAD domain-containing protein [Methanimicrococcus sp.]